MPGEHELRIALATARRERDEALSREAGLARANKALADDLIDKCHTVGAAEKERDAALAQETYWHARATEARDEAEREKARALEWAATVDRVSRERDDLNVALAAALARADAAEAGDARLAAANKALADDLIDKCHTLAAARRECELWKQIAGDLYAPLEERDMHMCSASETGDVHANVCGTFGANNCPVCLVAALAAPAAGEEGKHG